MMTMMIMMAKTMMRMTMMMMTMITMMMSKMMSMMMVIMMLCGQDDFVAVYFGFFGKNNKKLRTLWFLTQMIINKAQLCQLEIEALDSVSYKS